MESFLFTTSLNLYTALKKSKKFGMGRDPFSYSYQPTPFFEIWKDLPFNISVAVHECRRYLPLREYALQSIPYLHFSTLGRQGGLKHHNNMITR